MEKLLCQRSGCYATFTKDNNPDSSCTYHESRIVLLLNSQLPLSCTTLIFLGSLMECKTGKHSTEKPVCSTTPKRAVPLPTPATNASPKEACSRCCQGFFCSDHGSQAKDMNAKPSNQVSATLEESNMDMDVQEGASAPAKKIIDINQPQICKNKGCGQTFKEKDNHATACNYHPDPAVFHDTLRGVRL